MMELIQRAALLNLEGASFLEQPGNEQQALASFNGALDCMSRAASTYYCTKFLEQIIGNLLQPGINTLIQQPPPSPTAAIPLMAIPKPPQDQREEPPLVSYQADEDSAEKNPEQFVYRQGLVFNPEAARTPVDSLFYSAVVIFNTALCFHKYKDGRSPNSAELLKAASLYDICLELLKECATRFDCSHIIVSAMNNKACLYIALKDYINANGVLDQLLSVIMSTKGVPACFTKRDMEGILHNVLLLKSSCISPAA